MATRISLLAAGLVGAAAIVVGFWWIHPAAGLIMAGALLLADVIHIACRRDTGDKP
jgi:hypothetical protein